MNVDILQSNKKPLAIYTNIITTLVKERKEIIDMLDDASLNLCADFEEIRTSKIEDGTKIYDNTMYSLNKYTKLLKDLILLDKNLYFFVNNAWKTIEDNTKGN